MRRLSSQQMTIPRNTGGSATHSFTLVLAGVTQVTSAMEEVLFTSGCDDALLGASGGTVYMDFDREATSFRQAVASALTQVTRAGLKVARVERTRTP
jgi:hypothetical protein